MPSAVLFSKVAKTKRCHIRLRRRTSIKKAKYMHSKDEHLIAQISAYYSARLAEHGPCSLGVDWNGAESHHSTHNQFLRLLAGKPTASVLDLGCGYGDFLPFLRQAGFKGLYVGLDVAPAMIEEARRLHGEGSDHSWQIGSVPEGPQDFAIASGVFNVKGGVPDEEWVAYVWKTIERLAQTSRLGFAFNILSTSSDPERRRPNLFYADPVTTLASCLSRFGRHIALLQDYGLYEFTIIGHHDPA